MSTEFDIHDVEMQDIGMGGETVLCPPLPVEIFSEIARNIDQESFFPLRMRTLKICTLVSKTFQREFQPYIFTRIEVQDAPSDLCGTLPSLKRFIQLLDCNPDMGKRVRFLKLVFEVQRPSEVAVVPGMPPAPPPPFILAETAGLMQQVFSRLPNLHHLWLQWSEPMKYFQIHDFDIRIALRSACNHPSLKCLTLHSLRDLPAYFVIDNPQVECLSLDNVNVIGGLSPVKPLGKLIELNVASSDIAALVYQFRESIIGLRRFRCNSTTLNVDTIQQVLDIAAGTLQEFDCSACCSSSLREPSDREETAATIGPFDLSLNTHLRLLRLKYMTIQGTLLDFNNRLCYILHSLAGSHLQRVVLEFVTGSERSLSTLLSLNNWHSLEEVAQNQDLFVHLKWFNIVLSGLATLDETVQPATVEKLYKTAKTLFPEFRKGDTVTYTFSTAE